MDRFVEIPELELEIDRIGKELVVRSCITRSGADTRELAAAYLRSEQLVREFAESAYSMIEPSRENMRDAIKDPRVQRNYRNLILYANPRIQLPPDLGHRVLDVLFAALLK